MNRCKKCKKETKNPKFCSQSCAASHNNVGVRRHGKPRGNCINCNIGLTGHCKMYCSSTCQSEYNKKKFIQSWLAGNEDGLCGKNKVPSNYIRIYMFETYNYSCLKCGWSKIHPITGKVPLEIHHIDGNWKNNKFSNLQLLCKNCHSLTETYGSLNKGYGRNNRRH